jgi:hypothetical protein
MTKGAMHPRAAITIAHRLRRKRTLARPLRPAAIDVVQDVIKALRIFPKVGAARSPDSSKLWGHFGSNRVMVVRQRTRAAGDFRSNAGQHRRRSARPRSTGINYLQQSVWMHCARRAPRAACHEAHQHFGFVISAAISAVIV